MIRKDLIYIAGPYSPTKDFTIKENIARVEAVSIALIRNGFHVLTPYKIQVVIRYMKGIIWVMIRGLHRT